MTGLRPANRRIEHAHVRTPLAERIARVLAGAALSSNADGSDPSAGDKVDLAWKEHLNQALAGAAHHARARPSMAEAGDPHVWTRMVDAAIRDAE